MNIKKGIANVYSTNPLIIETNMLQNIINHLKPYFYNKEFRLG